MKILHIHDEHRRVWPGEGSGNYAVYNTAKYTAARGCEVTVLERRWEGLDCREEVEGIKFQRIDLHFCSSISGEDIPANLVHSPIGLLRFILDRIEFALKALKYLKNNHFDIVQVYTPFAPAIIVTLSRKVRKKMIYRELIGEIKKRLRFGPAKDIPLPLRIFSPDLYLMKRVRKVILKNEKVKAELASSGKIEPEKLIYIPQDVDASEFNPDISPGNIRERYAPPGKALVLFIGSIIPRKGVEYLVKAANIVVSQMRYKDVIFLLKGRDFQKEYLERIRKLIEEYNLAENVKIVMDYLPFDDLKKLYIIGDIYVLPALEDDYPPSLLEPLACGKPIIGTDTIGTAPVIKDGWNGLVVEPANERQLAEKIKYLLDHPEKWEKMGKNSRKLVEEIFDWKRIVERYLEVYDEIVSGR